MQIISSQVLPSKEEEGFDRVPIALRVEGELMALQGALVGLNGQSPEFWVDSLAVQTIGAVLATQPQRLGVQFTISVLRRRA
jgi:general secretion pathway protein M